MFSHDAPTTSTILAYMPKPTVKDLVTAMARDVLGPRMKDAGFRRTGRVFWRNGPEVCHVAAIVMSRWGSCRESSFDVQLGVFWHRVEKILRNPSARKMPPPEYRCTFRIDLGRAISLPPRPSWEVNRNSDFGSIGREVLEHLLEHGLAWFEYRSDLRRVLEWKRYTRSDGNGQCSMQEFVNADAKVVFKVMLGRRKAAVTDLKRFVQNGHRKAAVTLGKRLRIPSEEFVLT
jgi:hypothetical protein